MAWQDDLLDGSYRGAPFKIESHERGGGRRVHVHEYPGRDSSYPEDLGKKTGEYEVECYVIGRDYFPARDALIEACEAAGPAELVHPYLGIRRASCTGYKVSERAQRGGMATFTLTLVDAGENRYPAASADTAQAVAETAADAWAAMAAQFVADYRL